MTASPYTLTVQLQKANDGLEDAALCGAVTVHAEAAVRSNLLKPVSSVKVSKAGTKGDGQQDSGSSFRLNTQILQKPRML